MNRMTKNEKQDRVRRICDAAVSLNERDGTWLTIPFHRRQRGADIRIRSFERDDFRFLYWTPFQVLPINEELVKQGFGSAAAQRLDNGLYGLDLYYHAAHMKVLSVRWNDPDGDRTIVTFKPGEWEYFFLKMATPGSIGPELLF